MCHLEGAKRRVFKGGDHDDLHSVEFVAAWKLLYRPQQVSAVPLPRYTAIDKWVYKSRSKPLIIISQQLHHSGKGTRGARNQSCLDISFRSVEWVPSMKQGFFLATMTFLWPQDTCPGVAAPTGTSHIDHQLRKCNTGSPTGQPSGGIFFFSMQDLSPSLCRVDLKPVSTSGHLVSRYANDTL